MREIARIDRVTTKLNKVWHHFPDMRFFQLVSFIVKYLPDDWHNRDLFFLEDPVTETTLDKLIAELDSKADHDA